MTEPASSYETSVLIVGGGPAGLATAIALAQAGIDSTVVEAQAPGTDKACGEGLMPAAVDALHDLGISLDAHIGLPFSGIRFADSRHCVDAVFGCGPGRGVRRPDLHHCLAERAARLGVQLCWNTRVRLLDEPSGSPTASGRALLNEQEIRFRWLVGADGQASGVRRWAGLDAWRSQRTRFGFRRHFKLQPWSERVEVHWARQGQIYVTPVSADSICVVGMTHQPHTDWHEFLAGFPELNARLAGAALHSQPRGAVSAMRRLKRVANDHVALVGDASGSADSITGEGLAMTFQQALALAESIASGSLAGYEQRHRSIGRRPHWMGGLMLTLDRWPVLVPPVLGLLQQWPGIFSSLVNFHTRRSPWAARPVVDLATAPMLNIGETQLQLEL